VCIGPRAQVAGADWAAYRVHQHHPGAAQSDLAWVDGTVSRGWCHILDGERLEASLAPVAFGTSCPACGAQELFLADRLVLCRPGQPVQGYAVGCGHAATARVPSLHGELLSRAVQLWGA
jgi:hypothetical protein